MFTITFCQGSEKDNGRQEAGQAHLGSNAG